MNILDWLGTPEWYPHYYLISIIINLIILFYYGRKLIRQDGGILYFREFYFLVIAFLVALIPIANTSIAVVIILRASMNKFFDFLEWSSKFDKVIIWRKK
jgi:hypothetical protein